MIHRIIQLALIVALVAGAHSAKAEKGKYVPKYYKKSQPTAAEVHQSDIYLFEPNQPYPRRFVDRPFTLGKYMSEPQLEVEFLQGEEQFNDQGDYVKTTTQAQNINLMFQGRFGYEYYFDLAFRVPYHMKEIEDVSGPYKGETYKGSGMGDVEIMATYQLQNTGRFFIAFTTGFKLPGTENTDTEGDELTTGSGTMDLFVRVPFKKAWRNWALGGMGGFRFFGLGTLKELRFGNRLDIEVNAIIQAGDHVAFKPKLVFWSQGSSGLTDISKPGEASANKSFYGLGIEAMINPTRNFDLIVSYLYPMMGSNIDKYTIMLSTSVAFRF